MRPRRPLPSLKRLLFEYLAMVAVFMAVLIITGVLLKAQNLILAMIAMLVTMFIARSTRPKGDNLPPGTQPPASSS